MTPVQANNGKSTPIIGFAESFRVGDHERVEQVLGDLKALGVRDLRTSLSWADWHTPEGESWYDWLLPRLARDANVLLGVRFTPSSVGVNVAATPRDAQAYTDFLNRLLYRFGDRFEWFELWNERHDRRVLDWLNDAEPAALGEFLGTTADWLHQHGKKALLTLSDAETLRALLAHAVGDHVDAVGIAPRENAGSNWTKTVETAQRLLTDANAAAEVWLSSSGFSTWRHDYRGQMRRFVDALNAPVKRLYWYAVRDLDANAPAAEGFHTDEREYHFGLRRADGTPKLLYRMWASGGLDAVREIAALPVLRVPRRYTLITGGSGFVGTNLAHRILSSGKPVLLYDNLSRPGVENNLRWLKATHGDLVQIEVADVRDPYPLRSAVKLADQVFHFAAQVAVTTSIDAPAEDFAVNAGGTLNLLEALRALTSPPPLVFTSTNKVYGSTESVQLNETPTRYVPADQRLARGGMDETMPLDFHSPYGCSKGVADQYILDFARTYGLRTAVFRMSCIYGPHQFGNEDQGWVAHFLISALHGQPITLYGDGKQVRDVLFVEDLVDAFLLAQQHIDTISGQAFNIGGGAANTISLLELLELIGELHGVKPTVKFSGWRPGDQRYYVSDTGKFARATGWKAHTNVEAGIKALYHWLIETLIPDMAAREAV